MAMHKRLCMPSIAQLYAPQCQAARRGDARAPATITTSSPQLLPSNRTVNHPQHCIMVDLTADAPPPAKKVRVACRRCRAKRVKVLSIWPGARDTTSTTCKLTTSTFY